MMTIAKAITKATVKTVAETAGKMMLQGLATTATIMAANKVGTIICLKRMEKEAEKESA